MKSKKIVRENWYDESGLNLLMTCEGDSCLAEITAPESRGDQIRVEVLLQPTGERGLALGSPILASDQTIRMQSLPGGERRIGRFWLPAGLSQQAARTCYFRVTQPEAVKSCGE